jgi:GTP cyclohydrolase IA
MKELKHSNGNIILDEADKSNRIILASEYFAKFMEQLGFDYKADPNSADTPMRVTKSIMNDLCYGCFNPPPKITAFDNVDGYNGIVAQTNIPLYSLCAHHWLPFTGKAHVAYIPSKYGKVIGLSKINRLVDWLARRPNVQETLTEMIHTKMDEVCEFNNGIAVVIEANHTCCSMRGIKHDSTMRTAKMSGSFLDDEDNSRSEFYKFVEFAHNDK